MNRIPGFRSGRQRFAFLTAVLAVAILSTITRPALAQVSLTQISSDPFTVPPGQHATEVEPHVLANGSTIVAAFQTGRIAPGGATDIGWATSTDGGSTWTHGFLPGLTTGEGSGPYSAASDPAVAFDAAHNVWMIASLPIASFQTPAVVVSRSLDGGLTWQNPVSVDSTASSSDKNWIVCDSNSGSPFFGHCYVEWDNPAAGDEILMSTSTDGGQTWGAAIATANRSFGIGGQPLVQPNGTVIVPIEITGQSAFTSTNGGVSWSKPVTIANIQSHLDAGGIRSGPLPSAAVDGAGTVYVVWEDCRFRNKCSTNDLAYSSSSDGVHWSKVTRVPIDPVTSTVDHFIPGIGIDPATSGSSAHIAIHYYFYSKSSCTKSTCQLFVGYISSPNGGSTWSKAAAGRPETTGSERCLHHPSPSRRCAPVTGSVRFLPNGQLRPRPRAGLEPERLPGGKKPLIEGCERQLSPLRQLEISGIVGRERELVGKLRDRAPELTGAPRQSGP